MENSKYQTVEGRYMLSDNWEITLPGKFSCRRELREICIKRLGLTIWANVIANSNCSSVEQRLSWIEEDMDPEAFDVSITRQDGDATVSFRLLESLGDHCPAFHSYTLTEGGDLLLSMYFEHEEDLAVAQEIVRSVKWTAVVTP